MNLSPTLQKFQQDLYALGLRPGDTVMIHSSFKSLGKIEEGAAGIFDALKDFLGEEGTMLLPAFSYDSVGPENPIFDRNTTPSCVGYLPEYFRTNVSGVIRSLHATHSCSIWGKRAEELAKDHELDLTPVGKNSPLYKMSKVGGKILFLGADPDHNTAMHGVEETTEPDYLFDRENLTIEYVLRDGDHEIRQTALRHCFEKNGFYYEQKYGRLVSLLSEEEYSHGFVLQAECYLLSSAAVWEKGHAKLKEDPHFFINKKPLKK